MITFDVIWSGPCGREDTEGKEGDEDTAEKSKGQYGELFENFVIIPFFV